MARVTPLLSSTSWIVMLSPIVLMLLVASWPTPAVEARSLQAHDEPQWMQEIHKSSEDENMPFAVRLRRSPQEPEQQPEEKPSFFSSIWTTVKNFAFTAIQAVRNFFGGIFGGNPSHRPDSDGPTTPPNGGGSTEPAEIGGGSSGHIYDNRRTSETTGKSVDKGSTGPNQDRSSASNESPESSEERIGDRISAMPDNGGRNASSDIGIPPADDGSTPVNYHGNGDHETTSKPVVIPITDSAENEIPDN